LRSLGSSESVGPGLIRGSLYFAGRLGLAKYVQKTKPNANAICSQVNKLSFHSCAGKPYRETPRRRGRLPAQRSRSRSRSPAAAATARRDRSRSRSPAAAADMDSRGGSPAATHSRRSSDSSSSDSSGSESRDSPAAEARRGVGLLAALAAGGRRNPVDSRGVGLLAALAAGGRKNPVDREPAPTPAAPPRSPLAQLLPQFKKPRKTTTILL
jgi:hypothetical protein